MVPGQIMNTLVFHPDSLPPQLVDFVDFKWLMRREGRHIDVQRLQSDAGYARQCLADAQASSCEMLRLAATKLRKGLGL